MHSRSHISQQSRSGITGTCSGQPCNALANLAHSEKAQVSLVVSRWKRGNHELKRALRVDRPRLLPPEVLPIALKEIETRLATLISYDRDIFILHDGARLPLWKKGRGWAPSDSTT